jgi:hypothetical protein
MCYPLQAGIEGLAVIETDGTYMSAGETQDWVRAACLGALDGAGGAGAGAS